VDSLAIFPFDWVVPNEGGQNAAYNDFVRITRIGRLYKLVKLTKLIRVLKIVKERSKLASYV
jgi:hypothetical protein